MLLHRYWMHPHTVEELSQVERETMKKKETSMLAMYYACLLAC